MPVETHWADSGSSRGDWAEAFDAAEPGTPHNEAREQVWEALVTILVDQHDEDVAPEQLRTVAAAATTSFGAPSTAPGRCSMPPTSSATSGPCRPTCARARRGSSPDEVAALQRADAQAWTVSDLPLLDAARQRLGDPEAARRAAPCSRGAPQQREQMAASSTTSSRRDDSEVMVCRCCAARTCSTALIDEAALPRADPDLLAGPFAHIVVDEAQELTDAEWQMLLLRCPSRSFTIVGDRAQARHGFTESWQERLERVGARPDDAGIAERQLPHAGGGHGRGRAGHPRRAARRQRADLDPQQRHPGARLVAELGSILDTWLAEHATASPASSATRRSVATARVRSLTPELAKGLEFDLVVLVDPDRSATVSRARSTATSR